MKIDGVLKKYYERRLTGMDVLRMPQVRGSAMTESPGRQGTPAWEQVLGYAVTAAYLLQWLLPDRWFLVGRFISVFRIGF